MSPAGSSSARASRTRSRSSSSSAAARARRRSGRSATSRSPIAPGEAVALVGQERVGQVDAPPADRGDHQAHRGPGLHRWSRRLAPRARRRLPPRLHRSRERRAERDAPGAHPGADPRAVRRDRRVRRARARDRPPRPDLLVRHDDAAGVRDRRVPRGGRAAPRRGVRRRRRELPAEVLRRDRGLQGAGRHDPLRLPRRVRGRAPLRPCGAAARRDARVRRAGARGDHALPARAGRRR